MCVCTADGAGGVLGRPGSAANGFVIAEPLVAEDRVVHRSLAGRGQFQGTQQHVDHALRRLDVAAGHRRTLFGPGVLGRD